jgi:hypothetical protein
MAAETLSGARHVCYAAREGQKFNADTTLVVVACCTCGIVYAIPQSLRSSALEYRGDKTNGWRLVCPLGHEWWYVGETEVERERRLRRQAADRAGRAAHERDQAQAQARAERAAKTRFKNQRNRERARTRAGVCPCCGRTFRQLARHMKSQHPDWPDDKERAA